MSKRVFHPLLASSLLLPTLASAQEAAPLALEEVVVTAQKKEESLQDTPISLTAFGEDQLENQGISNLGDIGAKVPAMSIEPFPINNATLRIFIRGIGISDAQVTQDPPVGIYVDGVYIARSTGTALDVAELQRIEILRGPQGTLYGRNTTGGAINMITKRPTAEAVEFKQKFTVGNRNQFTSKTSANIPISDTLAVKLSYLDTKMDGFIENTGPGGDFGDKDVQGARVDFRWDATDWLTVDYAWDKSEMEFYNYMYQAITTPESDKGEAEAIKRSAQANSRYSDKRFSQMATGAPFESSDTEIEGHSLILTANFENFSLKYIGAYRELYDASYADLGGGDGSTEYRLDSNAYDGPAATAANGGPTPLVKPVVTQDQFSHEFQLSGDLFESRVEYIVGAYYFEETAQEDNTPLHHQLSAPVDNGGGARTVNLLSQRYDIDNTAAAIFGQATWTPDILEDRLHLTFGARHSEDEREAVKFQIDRTYAETPSLIPGVPGTAIDVSGTRGDRDFDNVFAGKTFKDDSFSFVAEYDLTDDINVYGKVIEAYKSGGFNTRDPQVDGNQGPASDGNDYGFGFTDGFEEEKVLSYEFGIKSELMNRRLRINANVFQSEYTDMQLNFILTGTVADTKVTNAGEAEMRGFEMDLTFLATREILLMLNYAYLDTEVTKATDPFGNDVSDEFVFFAAPEHSGTLVMDWTLHQADWGRTSLNLSYNYMDERNGGSRAENVERGTFLPKYELLNARFSVNDIPAFGGLVNVALWGKNVLNEEYPLTAVDNLPHVDRAVIWGEPRTYGLDISYNY